jgi:Zn-dependent protease with chaperone function
MDGQPTQNQEEGNADARSENMTKPSEVRCWSCKISLPVTAENRGKIIKCPACGTKQRLPLLRAPERTVGTGKNSQPTKSQPAEKTNFGTMSSRVGLIVIILAIPLVGFGVADAMREKFDSELRSAIQKQYPSATQDQLAQTTIDDICRDATAELGDICLTNTILKIVSRAAIGSGVAGLALLILIGVAGVIARNSRTLLVVLFRPGLYFTAVVLICLVIINAVVIISTVYYGESALIGSVHIGIIAAIGLGALGGVVAIGRNTFSLVRRAETFVIGKALSRDDAPQLWKRVQDTAERLGALQPTNIVAGLDPNFFVTEANVISLTGRLSGRTLYCSLPLCRILSEEELISIIGHELGHFKGQDTKFSERFYPIYRGTASSLAGLQVAGGKGSGLIALLPAIAVLSYFMECFAVAESRLSRFRELAADQTGANVTSPRSIATALVKLHAFTGIWAGLQGAAISALHQGKMFVNASLMYADAVSQSAGPEALKGIVDASLSHPTDSHPSLSVRLASLQVKLDDLSADALVVTPMEQGIKLVPQVEKLEEDLSESYQSLLAHQYGIILSNTGRTARLP